MRGQEMVQDMLFRTKTAFYQAIVEREYMYSVYLASQGMSQVMVSTEGKISPYADEGDEFVRYEDDTEFSLSMLSLLNHEVLYSLYVHKDDLNRWPKQGSPLGEEATNRLWVKMEWPYAPWLGQNDTIHSWDTTINYLLETDIRYLKTGVGTNEEKLYRAVGYERENIKNSDAPTADYRLVRTAAYVFDPPVFEFEEAMTPLEQALFDDIKAHLHDMMTQVDLTKGTYWVDATLDLAARDILCEEPAWPPYQGTAGIERKLFDDTLAPDSPLQAHNELDYWQVSYKYRYDESQNAYVFDAATPITSIPPYDPNVPEAFLPDTLWLSAGGVSRIMITFPCRYAYQECTLE
jgi:hypothetical protein